MQKLIILVLLVICINAQEDLDMKIQIEKLDHHRFGHTLLDTIWLQLSTQEPIERLMGTLEAIEDRYISDQKEEDHSHKEYQDACTTDLQLLDQNINISDSERIKLEARLEGELYPKRDILKKLIFQKETEVKGLNKDLQELDDERNEEDEEFKHKINEHEDVIGILSQARSLFADNLQSHDESGSSFIQKLNNNGLELLQKHFTQSIKRASKFTYRTSWGKLFKALATITSRVDQLQDSSQVQNVILLIDQLLEKVHDSMDLEKFSESKRIQSYDKSRNLLVISINTANSTLANAISDLASVEDVIEQVTATLDNVNQRLEMLEESRNDRFINCEQEAQDYQDARKQRDEDKDVVSQTIGLLNRSLRTLKEQLALRMQAGEVFEY